MWIPEEVKHGLNNGSKNSKSNLPFCGKYTFFFHKYTFLLFYIEMF